MQLRYFVPEPKDGWRQEFTAAEKSDLRTVAETLAMLDGNAFFGATYIDNKTGEERDWYEMYLPEAIALFESNGSPNLGPTHQKGQLYMGPINFPSGREIVTAIVVLMVAAFMLGYGMSTFFSWLGS